MRQHGNSVTVSERRERRVFTTPDGRILGSEVLIEEWMTPFEKSGETTETETVVKTLAFPNEEQASYWKNRTEESREVLARHYRSNVATQLRVAATNITDMTTIAREALSLDPPRIHIAIEKIDVLHRIYFAKRESEIKELAELIDTL